MDTNDLTERIIGAAIEVHRALGPGLLESAYHACMVHELGLDGMRISSEVRLPLCYRGLLLECSYKLDLIVEKEVVVELKSIDKIEPIHLAQLLTYLKLSGCPVGLLINFNVPVLKAGIRRLVNNFKGPIPGRNSNAFVHGRVSR